MMAPPGKPAVRLYTATGTPPRSEPSGDQVTSISLTGDRPSEP